MDIDIDLPNRKAVLDLIPYTEASLKDYRRHNVGVYFQEIPKIPGTNRAVFDYQTAEKLGWMKFDFLNLHIYEKVRDERHLVALMNAEPEWDLLKSEEIVHGLFQLTHSFQLLQRYPPKSVADLAVVLALIRPAAEGLRNLPFDEIKSRIWNLPESGYAFKKSHAFSYAFVVVVQLNLLLEGVA